MSLHINMGNAQYEKVRVLDRSHFQVSRGINVNTSSGRSLSSLYKCGSACDGCEIC